MPYVSKLKVAGKEIPFIHQASMRFIGEELYQDLSDSEVRATVSVKFKNLLEKIDHDKVFNNGILWI